MMKTDHCPLVALIRLDIEKPSAHSAVLICPSLRYTQCGGLCRVVACAWPAKGAFLGGRNMLLACGIFAHLDISSS